MRLYTLCNINHSENRHHSTTVYYATQHNSSTSHSPSGSRKRYRCRSGVEYVLDTLARLRLYTLVSER